MFSLALLLGGAGWTRAQAYWYHKHPLKGATRFTITPVYHAGRPEIRSVVTRTDFVARQIWVRILLLTLSSCVGLGLQPPQSHVPGCHAGALMVPTS